MTSRRTRLARLEGDSQSTGELIDALPAHLRAEVTDPAAFTAAAAEHPEYSRFKRDPAALALWTYLHLPDDEAT